MRTPSEVNPDRRAMSDLTRFVRADEGEHARVFVPPSDEAMFLVRHFGWLVAPRSGRGSLFSRAVRVAVVAPFTQFTFVSFELQLFLFQVFHQSRLARLGHFVGMMGVNFFMMAGLAQFRAASSISGATLYALVLLVWYALVARSARLWGWWLVTAPIVVALAAGSRAYFTATSALLDPAGRSFFVPTPLAFNPWLWAFVAAALIAFSHFGEEKVPPHLSGSLRWRTLGEYWKGDSRDRGVTPRIVHTARLVFQTVSGILSEWWAAPRLLPYNFLMIMFRLGYRPSEAARLRGYADRAIESGDPAIDFVGIGGGAFLRVPTDANGT